MTRFGRVPQGTAAEFGKSLLKSAERQTRAVVEILISGSPQDFGKVVAEETEKWAKVIKTGGVALE
jgi:hypothetical protein